MGKPLSPVPLEGGSVETYNSGPPNDDWAKWFLELELPECERDLTHEEAINALEDMGHPPVSCGCTHDCCGHWFTQSTRLVNRSNEGTLYLFERVAVRNV